jgi:predicted  nucleic acid-binding Zn-ribbon protein
MTFSCANSSCLPIYDRAIKAVIISWRELLEGDFSVVHPTDGSGLSFIFTTIERNNCARRLIDSALAFYPKLKILVADQNAPTQEMEAYYRDRGVAAHWVPFDFGVSASRALLARKVETPLLVYGDDDFVFTSRTRFAPVVDYLHARPDVAVVTGGMVDQVPGRVGAVTRLRRRYETFMYRDLTHRGLVAVPIDHVRPDVDIHEGEVFYACDLGLNWAMVRTSLFDDERFLWDSQFKTNGEHENFFLQLKEFGGGRVMFYPPMECDHLPETHAEYEVLRARDQGWAAFGQKWDLDWFLHVGQGFHLYKNYTGSEIRYVSGAQGAAQVLPPRRDDYLRIWADGSSTASLSPSAAIREATERTRRTWEKAEKRIEKLRARLQGADAEKERMTRTLRDLRSRVNHDTVTLSAPNNDAEIRTLQLELKKLTDRNNALQKRIATHEERAKMGAVTLTRPAVNDGETASGANSDLTDINLALREKNAELREKVARQTAEAQRQRAVIDELRKKLKDTSGARPRAPSGQGLNV